MSDHLRGRFPRTPHLVNGPLTGKAVTRDDLTLSDADADQFLFADPHGKQALGALRLTVEEKLDGANLGIGLAADGGTLLAQNRSHHVNGATAMQWAGLPRFLDETKHEFLELFYALPEDANVGHALSASLRAHTSSSDVGPGGFGQPPAVPPDTHETAAHPDTPACDWLVFGEWLAFQHSVFYDKLPSPFVVFDVYHVPSQRFLSADLRDRLIAVHCPSLVTSRRVYAAPLVPRPPKSAAPTKTGKSSKATPLPAPVLVRDRDGAWASERSVTSWAEFHALWHRKPSAFFAGHGDKGRAEGGGANAPSTSAPRQMEGVVLRVDDAAAGFQLMRCKAVHDEFIAAIDEHWRKQAPVKNIVLAPDAAT